MKLTPSFLGLCLEILALALILALVILGKIDPIIFYLALASIALYFIAIYHLLFEKPKKGTKL